MLQKMRSWAAGKLDPSLKSNPTQEEVYDRERSASSIENINFIQAYKKVEIFGRGVNLITDLAADISFDIGETLPSRVTDNRFPRKQLEHRLNFTPNPFIDRNRFKRELYMDLLLLGNAFLYFDGEYLYNIPANDMEIFSHPKRRVSHYEYGGQRYNYDEIIHIADNSSDSYLKGSSRLESTELTANTIYKMIGLQRDYVDNGLSLGDVLLNDDMLGRKQKQRYLSEIARTVGRGRKRPAFLDGGTKLDRGRANLKEELDFDTSIKSHEERIFKALGIPPVLINGGNNANIAPNMKLFYLFTILPLAQKLESALESFFGYNIRVNKAEIVALQPEMKEQSSFLVSMVNNGLMTVNEAREILRYNKFDGEDYDTPRNPENITGGSAVRPETGGRPTEEDNDEEN